MPLQDFETFKREHIDRPAVGDIWRHLDNDLLRVLVSNADLVLFKSLFSGRTIRVEYADNLGHLMDNYKFETRSIPTNYNVSALRKKFFEYFWFNSSPLEIRVVENITRRSMRGREYIYVETGYSNPAFLEEWDFYSTYVEIESYIQRLRHRGATPGGALSQLIRSIETGEQISVVRIEEEIQVVRGETYNREQFHLIRDFTFTEHLYYDDMGADPSEDGEYSCDFTGNNKVDPVRLNSGHIYCFEEIKGLFGQPQSQWKCPNSREDITSVYIMTQEDIDQKEKKAVETELERLDKLKECKGYLKKIKDTKEEIKKKQERLDKLRKSRDQPILKF